MGDMKKNIDRLRAEIDSLLPKTTTDKLNVLVVDDEPQNLRAFKGLFRKEFNIFTSSDLAETLDVVNSTKIDFIFCDFSLKGITGADILHEIIKIKPCIKRIVLTGYNNAKNRRELFEKSNTTNIINKPYTFNQIINSITDYNFNSIPC